MKEVFLGLGGNIGNPVETIKLCGQRIAELEGLNYFKLSRLYRTTPVSAIPQADYVNAAALIHTTLDPRQLFLKLAQIETDLGKIEKNKDEPRVIDIDILLFGDEYYEDSILSIPHPRWQERLFVVKPLSDLAKKIKIPVGKSITQKKEIDLEAFLRDFKNIHDEIVLPIT